MIPASMPPSSDDVPRWFPQRSALAFSAPMIVNGIALPFFPVWLATLNLDDREIGTILAVPMFVRIIVAPLVAMLADRLKERATVLIWSGGLSLLTALALFVSHGFWPVLIVYALQGATYAPYMPVTEAILVNGVRRWGYDYGRMRMWGSLAFILSTLVGGYLIGLWGGKVVLPAMVFGFILTVTMGFLAPRVGKSIVTTLDAERENPSTRRSALRRRDLQVVMIGSSLVQASHAMQYAFSSIYWEKLGFSGGAVGILWSAGVLAEVVAFYFSQPLARRFTAWTLIRLGATVAVCRWILFPLATDMLGFLLLQCLHAFTFAFCHMGIQRLIVRAVREEQEASAQGAYFFYNGLFMAISTVASGFIHTRLGLSGYYTMSVVALSGLACVIAAFYLQPQRAASGGNTSESR
ncbi:MFS transporter [Rhizobiaceae bacterium n13]|uniref:MFS transporter n=1 Tax=Ferirhizobium litorale TaxID=2927786 RepID=A0AAE3U5A5_9HYPH|nr:MFS transporter [Fererhizobium litorale]MDI7863885.1 MFS transporter [Fererhizobium litorale]MDI7924283.1 MFS transporter [Fererhizobium litorale]